MLESFQQKAVEATHWALHPRHGMTKKSISALANRLENRLQNLQNQQRN